MLLGPFDQRRKRLRCDACSSSHLKCSGQLPCTKCDRRRVQCSYSAAKRHEAQQQVITLDRGRNHCSTVNRPIQTLEARYLHSFGIFAQRNSFDGSQQSLADYISKSTGLQASPFLIDAVWSLGALQTSRSSAADPSAQRQSNRDALRRYTNSVQGLRSALDSFHIAESSLRAAILWTTLLLGIFELMSDRTGDGWLRHMSHGTAQALEATGPSLAQGRMLSDFFAQARIFEVSRSIIYNEISFLARPEWLDRRCSTTSGLDALLDIMVQCSQLRARTIHHLKHHRAPDEARAIAQRGLELSQALSRWSLSSDAAASAPSDEEQHTRATLATVFHSATTIYLSGIFDYDIPYWHTLHIAPLPTLTEQSAQHHARRILELARSALDEARLSPLLFLFPLRIAGARSRTPTQREAVLALLGRVGRSFVAAEAMVQDLEAFWAYWG